MPVVAILGYLAVILSYATDVSWQAQRLFRSGLGYFFGSDLAKVGVQEAMPIFRVYEPLSLPILGLALSLIGLIFLIRNISPSDHRKDRLLFLVWAGFATALMIFQTRFLFLFSISGSVLVALLFLSGAEWIRSSERFQGVDPRLVKVAIGLFLLVLLLPFVVGLPALSKYEPEITGDWSESLEWMRENTPPTKGFERPTQAGEYGVLSWWDYGNWVLYRSERPVVANNFQAGARDSAIFFLSEEEEEAGSIAEARNVRYVVTDVNMVYRKLPAIARWIGEDPESYVRIATDSDIATYEVSTRFAGTMLAKLHLLDCKDLGHFRLIYESKTSSGLKRPVNEVKIFEKVPGAKISGMTPYDEPIGLVLEMTSNQGRRFQYFNSAMPVDGRYEICVPYSTEEGYGTHSVGPYLLGPITDVVGGEAREIEVSEEDVLNGATIEVNF